MGVRAKATAIPVMISARDVCSAATAARTNGSCCVSVTISVSNPAASIAAAWLRKLDDSSKAAQLSFMVFLQPPIDAYSTALDGGSAPDRSVQLRLRFW